VEGSELQIEEILEQQARQQPARQIYWEGEEPVLQGPHQIEGIQLDGGHPQKDSLEPKDSLERPLALHCLGFLRDTCDAHDVFHLSVLLIQGQEEDLRDVRDSRDSEDSWDSEEDSWDSREDSRDSGDWDSLAHEWKKKQIYQLLYDECDDCGSDGNEKGAWSTIPSLKNTRTVDETL